LAFSIPIKLTITDQADKSAFKTDGGTTLEITTTCKDSSGNTTTDPSSVTNIPPTEPQACKTDSDGDLVILTKRASTFSTGSPSPGPSPGPSAPAGPSGSARGTGIGPGSPGASSFGVILFSPLQIHKISYDVCTENMATILVANDDAMIPTVTLQTTKSGTVVAQLASEQPFEEKNKFTTVDKYLFVAPLDPKETFFMVQVKAIDGSRVNSVNSAVYLTECQGIILFDVQPEQSESKATIPDWIHNNAKWWSEGQIEDSDFVSGIQFMIKENIMVIPDLQEAAQKMELKDKKRAMGLERDKNVPDWVRNNAGWWSDGLISDDDFVSGIKYLVEQGIIRV